MAGKTANRIGWAISILASGPFLLSAFFKFKGGPELEQGFGHLGIPMTMRLPLGVLELTCAAIYLFPQSAVLGAVLLTGFLGGAICTHWRVGDPFYIHILIGLSLWLGVYLREDRLKALLPLRTGLSRRP